MKPRLPRKLATSARINLNKYWHALEDLMPIGRRAFDESESNAINENIDNERRLAAMRLADIQESRSLRTSTSGKTSDAFLTYINEGSATIETSTVDSSVGSSQTDKNTPPDTCAHGDLY